MYRLTFKGKLIKENTKIFWYAGTNLKAAIYIWAHNPIGSFTGEYLLAPNNSLNEIGISLETLSFPNERKLPKVTEFSIYPIDAAAHVLSCFNFHFGILKSLIKHTFFLAVHVIF